MGLIKSDKFLYVKVTMFSAINTIDTDRCKIADIDTFF